ncbi:MAG: hypothetical protein CVV42_20785 [Candidatus Riflebacteria bacterium HGW-Riflebacteria-2]|jgi:methyl-accepting chemotaxis protein|nr:MAG: hypothetical protein CVV42_20785 [Candidatus Riflebacteria bacterium HGW-Riflebacteria-2]
MDKQTRKHYLILPSYQIRLVAFMSLVVFVGSILHGFFLYQITSKNIQEGFLSAHNRLRSTWEILKPAIIVTNSLSFLLITVFLLIVTVFISHRLIGPMFKVAGHLRRLSSGKLEQSSLRLREGDEGQVLCEAVNELQDKFRQRFVRLRKLKTSIAQDNLSSAQIVAQIDGILNEIEIGNENN